MCEFISWVEEGENILFLTDKELSSKRGNELRKYLGDEYDTDKIGHGAIRWFYDFNKAIGRNKECSDFSSPSKFPDEIVKAIKDCKFRKIGICKEILNQPALAEYEKIELPALAKYEKIKRSAWAEYEKIEQIALAEYKKIKQIALAEYKKIEQTAWAEYEKIKQIALAEYKKIKQNTFWDIAMQKKNRKEEWI